jgi:hypothetical protein
MSSEFAGNTDLVQSSPGSASGRPSHFTEVRLAASGGGLLPP